MASRRFAALATSIVVLTTGVPPRGHPNETAIRPLIGSVIHAVVELGAADPGAALAAACAELA